MSVPSILQKGTAAAILAVGTLLGLGCTARANVIVWTLHHVDFGDTGTATGSFAIDLSTFKYVSFDITTTGPGLGEHYTHPDVPVANAFGWSSTTPSKFLGNAFLTLNAQSPFLFTPSAHEPITLSEQDFIFDRSSLRGAFISASAGVPEPATWAMLLIGFAGLGVATFRRGAATQRWNVAA